VRHRNHARWTSLDPEWSWHVLLVRRAAYRGMATGRDAEFIVKRRIGTSPRNHDGDGPREDGDVAHHLSPGAACRRLSRWARLTRLALATGGTG